MPSNSLPDGDLNLQEMKTKSPTCPSGGYHMYAGALGQTKKVNRGIISTLLHVYLLSGPDNLSMEEFRVGVAAKSLFFFKVVESAVPHLLTYIDQDVLLDM